jgi:hypothetical protein
MTAASYAPIEVASEVARQHGGHSQVRRQSDFVTVISSASRPFAVDPDSAVNLDH